MKEYPSIPGWKKFPLGTKVIAFDKIDGSNIRCEWSKKKGWYKFGTRTQLLDTSHPFLGSAISLFLNKYGEEIAKQCVDEFNVKERIVAFCEFCGPSSFAGSHLDNEQKDVILLDVDIFKKGFISPRRFLKMFDHLHLPSVIYDGTFNKELVQDVQNNIFNLSEGIIAKAVEKQRIPMTKVKTFTWLLRLKGETGEEETDQ